MSLPARNALDTQQSWETFKTWLLSVWDGVDNIDLFLRGRGTWTTGTVYEATPTREWVINAGLAYVATINHTSGASFATDLAAGKWIAADVVQLQADLAATGTSKGGLLVRWVQAGTSADDQWVQDTLRERLSITQFGAVATVGVDNTAAIQAAINEALASGKALHVPAELVPFEHGALTVPYDASGTKRLRILGDHGIGYFAAGKTSALKFTGTTGHALTVQGRAGGVSGNNQGSPISFEASRVAWIGNASCEGAIRIARGWFANIEKNSFFGFAKVTGSVVEFDADDVDAGGISFSGSSVVEGNNFASSGRCIVLTGATGGVVNAVTIRGNKMLDQQYGVACNFGAGVPYAEHTIIECNHFEGTIVSDIFSQGAAANWVIERNYIEQNDVANNAPRVDIQGSANIGIIVKRNTFSKALQAAGQALVRVSNGRGVHVTNNTSNYGGSTDRFSVDLLTCVESSAEVMQTPSGGGTNSYPVRMNNYVITSGAVTDKWRTGLNAAANFHGISGGDGWPGGTVQTLSAIENKVNGLVTVQFSTTITTKSASSNNVYIGILPRSNAGGEIRFPVYAENVTGTKPLYGVLTNGQTVAQVYDANGAALNYATAVAVGSKFVAQLQYISQA